MVGGGRKGGGEGGKGRGGVRRGGGGGGGEHYEASKDVLTVRGEKEGEGEGMMSNGAKEDVLIT